jgi:hypothetical protein
MTSKQLVKALSDLLTKWEMGNTSADETCKSMSILLEDEEVPQ